MPFQPVNFPINRVTDRAVFENLAKFLAEGGYKLNSANYNLIFGQQETPVEDADSAKDSQLQEILALNTIAIKSFKFVIASTTIIINRQWQDHTLKGFQDGLSINPQQQDDKAARLARFVSLARKYFRAVEERAYLDYVKEEDKKYYEAREDSLQRLEKMQDAFFSKLQTFTIAQNETFQKRLDELQAQYDAKQKALEQQYQEKAKALAEAKTDFDKQKKEFDDRESKHLRRQIREQLKKIIADRSTTFELTKGAQRRRLPVIVVYALLLVLFGGLAGYFIIRDTPGMGQIDYLLVGRQVFFSALFGITAGFFVKWLNQWFTSHADEEFKLKRLELDIDRASWVVEMALEWKAEKGTEIPQFLIDRLSRNLFSEEEHQDGSLTAADALASAIFGSAASAKLKIGDAEVSLDRKAIGKLKKAGNDKE